MAMAALSDRGKVRPINEDSFCLPNGQMYLALVADGMGGHQAGEVASDMAASILSELAAKRGGKDISVKTAVSWVRKANAAIYASAQANPAQRGMGTTLTFLYFMHQRVMLGHVGDSRCYRLRDGQLAQLSTDHSLVQELVRNGTITQEEARNHPYKNIITRALGADEQVQVDAHDLQLSRSDVFLLCSDGLTITSPTKSCRASCWSRKRICNKRPAKWWTSPWSGAAGTTSPCYFWMGRWRHDDGKMPDGPLSGGRGDRNRRHGRGL